MNERIIGAERLRSYVGYLHPANQRTGRSLVVHFPLKAVSGTWKGVGAGDIYCAQLIPRMVTVC